MSNITRFKHSIYREPCLCRRPSSSSVQSPYYLKSTHSLETRWLSNILKKWFGPQDADRPDIDVSCSHCSTIVLGDRMEVGLVAKDLLLIGTQPILRLYYICALFHRI